MIAATEKKGLSEEAKESKNRNAAFLAMIPMHFLNGMAINMRWAQMERNEWRVQMHPLLMNTGQKKSLENV